MMKLNKTTIELVEKLTSAINIQNQELINIYAYELACRLYVPNKGYSIEQIMEGFGYKEIVKDDKQISIDEYMEEIKTNEHIRKRNENN